MTYRVSVRAQVDSLVRGLEDIHKVHVPKAYVSTMARLSRRVITETVKEVAREVNVNQKVVRRRVFIKHATPVNMETKMSFYARAIPAIETNFDSNNLGHRVAGRQYLRTFLGRSILNKKYHLFQRLSTADRKYRLPKRTKGRSYPIDVVRIYFRDKAKPVFEAAAERVMARDFDKEFETQLNARIKGIVKARR
jgi:hypothetical protein